jgi:hypothetical protein
LALEARSSDATLIGRRHSSGEITRHRQYWTTDFFAARRHNNPLVEDFHRPAVETSPGRMSYATFLDPTLTIHIS